MSESEEASVGQILREAREAQNFTLDEVAMRLRLMRRQIEAVETDDFESLGQPVFARGFVRNYARLMGLAPEALLARMAGAPAEPPPVSQGEPLMQRSWLTSPWLILLMLGLLVVVAVPVALYLWLNSDVRDIQSSPAPVTESRPAPLAAPVEALAVDVPVAAPLERAEPDSGSGEMAEAAAPSAATSPAATPPAASASVVHLELGAESWVEIKDASGRMLHRQLNPAGSNVDIRGQPPFSVLIGNASQARMTYNGRPIDLKPFIAVTVARFTLEE